MNSDQSKMFATAESIRGANQKFAALRTEISKVIVGHNHVVTHTLIALLSNGHILLEGVPGVAKTTLIKTIAQSLGLQFSRIQFTPDLLPADVVGTLVYNPKTQEFDTKKGPIFANLILADEINRAPAKVQAALLEAMQEKQVTIGSSTFKLEAPFLVFATQNPIENEGTYQLPEAQLDRFMCKITVGYPTLEEEKEIIMRSITQPKIIPVLTHHDILHAQELVKEIYVDDRVLSYILRIVFATRTPELYNVASIKKFIQYPASPRATLALYAAAKAYAFLEGRHFVLPEEVKIIAPAVLRHRILLNYEAQAQGISIDEVIDTILQTLVTP